MEPKRKKRRGLNILLNILIVACAAVLVYSLYNIFVIQREYGKATGEYDTYQQQVKLPTQPGAELTPEEETSLLEQLQTMFAENADFIAWISIPGTNIEYPVVQGNDNDYYLTHTFSGQTNSSGAIFMDYRNSANFNDANTIIYGHNMHNDTMFENLNQLLNTSTLSQHHTVYIATQTELLTYDIFSARQTDIEDAGYLLFPSDPAGFFQSLPGGSGLTGEDRVLTLSTCTYQAQSDLRVVVQARLVQRSPLDTIEG